MSEQKLKILLIEDNPGDAKLIQKLLPDDSGIELEWVDRLGMGLDQLKGKNFDGLLLDLSLPDSKGLETFMKTQKQSPHLPVLIMTGLDDKELALEAVRKGAQDYLVKGVVDSNVLVRAINYAIERKKAEETVRLSEEKLKRIIESSPNAITITGLDGKITDVNKATLDLYGVSSKEELIGKSTIDFIADRDRKKAMENLGKTVNQGLTRHMEYTLLTKDGREFPAEISASVIRDVTGKPTSLVGFTHDISKRKNAYEQIKTQLNEKERHIKDLHNRARNNLDVIFNLLEQQLKEIDDKKVKTMFKKTQSYIKSMSLIYEKLVETKDMQTIDFDEYIRDYVNFLCTSYRDYFTEINLNIDIKDVRLDYNRTIICSLIINELISNALVYAFPEKNNGEISLKIHPARDGSYVLSVQDNGIGVPQDLDLNNPKSQGLQSVNALVNLLDGNIELNRENGTSISIKFT